MLPPLLALVLAFHQGCVAAPFATGVAAVEGDTVRMRAMDGATAVAYDRARHAWRRVPEIPPRAVAGREARPWLLCSGAGDTVVAAPGVVLAPVDDSSLHATWGLRHYGDPVVPLRIGDRFRDRLRATCAAQDSAANPDCGALGYSPYLSAMLRDGDLLWFGLYGTTADEIGDPPYEGYDSYLGGLLRYSLRTRTLSSIPARELRGALVTSLAVAGGTLWIGTKARWPGREPETTGPGLVRYGRDGELTVFSSASSPLPDDEVGAIAAAGDTLWIVTRTGVALLDARAMRWDRRFFRTVYEPDSTWVRLDTAPPARTITDADRAMEMVVHLMDEMRLAGAERRAFARAVLAEVPRGELLSLRESYQVGRTAWYGELEPLGGAVNAAAEPLARPGLLPYLRRAIRRGAALELASAAILTLGDSTWRAELRSAMWEARPASAAARIASVLADSADPEALRWTRRALRDPAVVGDSVFTSESDVLPAMALVLSIAEAHPDGANAPALLDLLRATRSGRELPALFALGSHAPYAAMAAIVREEPRLALAYLDVAASVVWGADSLRAWRDSAARDAHRDVARHALRFLASLDSAQGYAVAQRMLPAALGAAPAAAIRLRDGAAVPDLIRIVRQPPQWIGAPANEALIRLTGAQPPFVTWESHQRLAAFWDEWWRTHAAGFTPVARAAGDAAFAEWTRRVRGRAP